MSGSDYRTAADGLPARVSGPWAQEKLTYLEKYMTLFSVGMKNRWRRVYLDLLAGCGRCIDEGTAEEFDGSPLRALQIPEPFNQIVCVERELELVEALETRVGGRATIIEGDCNHPQVINLLRGTLGHGVLGLAFIDNLGLDVPLSTIATLSEQRRLDLFIVFQVGDLKRNIRRVLSGQIPADRFEAFFGKGWMAVAEKAERENLSPDDTTTRLLNFYANQLGALGYPHVAHSRRIMKNSTRVGLYRLILAGKHERAVEFFNKISVIDPTGQRTFLP